MDKPKRGRPPKFNREAALTNAVATFWSHGYSATTLDDLVESTGMNRPSIYNAFGDKEAVYRHALEQFMAGLKTTIGERVTPERDLGRALRNLYSGALDVYFAREPSLGCFVFCTAPVEVVDHPAVRDLVSRLLIDLDELIADKFREAQEAGTWPSDRDPRLAARLAQGILHSIAIRARAGESRAALSRMAGAAVAWLTDC